MRCSIVAVRITALYSTRNLTLKIKYERLQILTWAYFRTEGSFRLFIRRASRRGEKNRATPMEKRVIELGPPQTDPGVIPSSVWLIPSRCRGYVRQPRNGRNRTEKDEIRVPYSIIEMNTPWGEFQAWSSPRHALTLLEPHSHIWGQNTLIISSLSPKRDWGPKRVKGSTQNENGGFGKIPSRRLHRRLPGRIQYAPPRCRGTQLSKSSDGGVLYYHPRVIDLYGKNQPMEFYSRTELL